MCDTTAKKVSVIILNWNGRHYLDDCLTSVLAQTYPNLEVILVDNGSSDGSADWVAERFPTVWLIRNEVNLGFAAGNNQAIRASKGAYIATLNNDTYVEPDWLASLVQTMETDPQVGMCASKMLFADSPEIINSTGICLDPVGIAWDRQGGEPDDNRETAPLEVFGPCAGAALYRRAMLDQIGLFDEDFFAYLEDVDVAWRAQLGGWRCLYVPAARVYHVHSGTSVEGSRFKNQLLGRNKLWSIAKNYPLRRLLLHLPLILAYDLAAVLYALVARGDTSALAGRWAGLRGLGRMLRKRSAVQSLRQNYAGAHWNDHLEPLVPPWKVLARYRHLTPPPQ
jgi:GT2 family glycosyltransferase